MNREKSFPFPSFCVATEVAVTSITSNFTENYDYAFMALQYFYTHIMIVALDPLTIATLINSMYE